MGTRVSHPPTRTLAHVRVHTIHASCVIQTRKGSALLHILLAELTLVAGDTDTGKGIHSVHTGSIVLTWFGHSVPKALVDVDVTVLAIPSLIAGAGVGARTVGADAM